MMSNRKCMIALISWFSIFNLQALVGVGSMSSFMSTYQIDNAGDTESILKPHPYIAVNHMMPAFGNHFFFPEIGYVFPKSAGDSDDAAKRSTLFLMYNLGYKVGAATYIKYGAATFITKIKSKGGTVAVKNGASGQTVTGYLPSESISSYNTTLNLGVEHFVKKNFTLKVESYLWSFLSSTARRVNFAFALNYYM